MRLRLVLVGWMLALVCLTGSAQPAANRFTDEEFAALIPRVSEEGGAFPIENFVSNERTFQVVIPRLRERVQPGGVYLGVGPEQNFTFISAVRPALAFIVDIRRQNMLEHLMTRWRSNRRQPVRISCRTSSRVRVLRTSAPTPT